MTGAHTHANTPGRQGPAGHDGHRGMRGARGRDSAPEHATMIFVILTIVLIGVVSVQAVAFRDFTARTCALTKSATQLRIDQAKAYRAFEQQEKTNRFIDEGLRSQRVKAWHDLALSAEATIAPAKRLCP